MNKFESSTQSIKTFFTNGISFYIPLYQREYSWQKLEISELLNDLNEFINNDIIDNPESKKIYYMGNLILKNNASIARNENILIDGQQRITTFLIFIKALKDVVKKKFSKLKWFENFEKRVDEMIFYKESSITEDEKKRIKLSNISGDEIIENILSKSEESIVQSNTNFYKNYKQIYGFLKTKISEENDVDVWFDKLFERIVFVTITITDAEDEHTIFENINSKGKDLSITDLIKNYLYIYAEKVYDSTDEEKNQIQELFDDKILKVLELKEAAKFFRQIIAYYTGELINESDTKKLYSALKTEVLPLQEKSIENIEKFITFLEKAFDTYEYIKSFRKRDPKNEFEFIMWIMNQQLIGSYFTVILKNAMINATFIRKENHYELEINNDFEDVIRAIEEWKLKIEIVYGSDKVITRRIPMILKDYHNQSLTRDDFLKKLSNDDSNDSSSVTNKSKYDMPGKTNVKRALIENDIKSSILAKHILYRINHHEDTKESNYTNIDDIQIEHIMPKEIRKMKCWKEALGENWEEKHAELIEKLGNLTLTGDNQRISNNCFSNEEWDKISKKENYGKSHIKITKELSKIEEFDEETINNRTEKLADIFISLYK